VPDEPRGRVTIRDAQPEDWEAVWSFFRRIVAAGETYAYERDMTEAEGRRMWMIGPPGRTVVAIGGAGTVAASANMYANRPGPGSHVASASFMVDPDRAGKGVGRALGEHVIDWARESGFRAIQFNAVVETNQAAVALWRSLGFTILATVPEAFDHPRHGYVGLLIMHRFL
jgi:L-amino acid N-acyltransferase YncA